MPLVKTFTVVPRLPERLAKLGDLAGNMWWCWDPEAIELFFRIDRDLWVDTEQSPTKMLGAVDQAKLEELTQDPSFLAHLDRVADRFEQYMSTNPWRDRRPETPEPFQAAYFSAEFGVQESVCIYSGGLGVLAGDHLKSASDLGLPLVAVGLLYREGYHRQYLNADGWQQEHYPRNDFYNMPLELMKDERGEQIVVGVPVTSREVKARIWKLQVGRVPLYLLDADFDANDEDDRQITAQLYGGDRDMRLRQEILLGMGGVKALRALGVKPTLFHMNEGHSAFMALQRMRDVIENEGLDFDHAAESVRAASVFTTHTPVPAGNDMFAPEMVERYFASYAQALKIDMQRLLGLGRQDPNDHREPFCMTVLALRMSSYSNGVSKLHGDVARSMWTRTWPGTPEDEIPITSITNGVHIRSWISRDMASLYDRYIGPDWVEAPFDPEVWDRIDQVPDAELWRTHERRRERLVNFARRRLTEQLIHRGAPQTDVNNAREVLDPEVLTIGFARRFATYKRANLFMADPERLVKILTNANGPVQFIIAGKAHPQDNQGKELIRNIIHFIREYDMRNHVLFLEDYDMNVARYMVQGVDCWLNTPRRPMEASGTSGMKAAANGALNISVPDGWWVEAESLGENGWSIGRGEMYDDPHEQDQVESEALYEILEREVVPAFYGLGRDNLPRHWVRRMKTAIRTICPMFNTHRMVTDYAERFYIPATERRNELRADDRQRSKELTAWKQKVRKNWGQVAFKKVDMGEGEELPFGSELKVTATLDLAGLSDGDVAAELYYGDPDPYQRIPHGQTVEMTCAGKQDGSVYAFEGAIPCRKTGQQAFMVRVLPSHPDMVNYHEMALVHWA